MKSEELSAIEQSGNAGGFVINGVSFDDRSGYSVSSAGDVNGDGLADLIVGASRDDPNGSNSGASYVVFGNTDGTVVELSDVENGTGGFVLNGVSGSDSSGFSVSSAGDVNGDGFADLIIGAYGADSSTGASFVVFGGDFSGVVDFLGTDGDDTLIGTSSDEILIGAQGNDTLDGVRAMTYSKAPQVMTCSMAVVVTTRWKAVPVMTYSCLIIH